MPFIWTDADDGELVLAAETITVIELAGARMYDQFRRDAAELIDGAAFAQLNSIPEWLPAGYAMAYTPELVLRVAAAIEATALKLTVPGAQLSCTAELLAAQAILGEAGHLLQEDRENDESLIAAPEGAEADIEELFDICLGDYGILTLFDLAKDGFDDDPELARSGPHHSRVKDWFRPFGPDSDSSELHPDPAPALPH